MKRKTIGYIMAVFTIMMWSLNIIYSKYLAGVMSPSEISFYRWFIGALVMIPVSYHSIRQDWKKLMRQWKLIIVMALTGIGFLNFFIYYAGYTASATNMSLISILGPIFLIALSRQRVNLYQIFGVCAAIFGVVTIILRGDFANLQSFRFVPGDVYMLASAFLFAVYSETQKKAPDNIHPTALLTMAIILSALIFLPPALPDILKTPLRSIPAMAWIILVILGIVNSAIAYLSWDIAIKKIGSVNAGTTYYLMPVFAIIFAHLLLHEKIYTVQIWGALSILIGILFVIIGAAKIRRELEDEIPLEDRHLSKKEREKLKLHPEQ